MTDRDLFIAALEQPEAERQAWLDHACGDDADLRRRLDVLLRAHELASQFLASPAVEQFVADQASPHGSTRSIDPAKDDHDDTADVLAILAPSEKAGQLGKLEHYEVLEVVGKGAMGVVVKAFDPKLHRVVAIKLMARHLAANAAARRRFEREARAVAAVRNAHVVAIHGVGPAGPIPYLVMEFIGGISLQDRLDQRGPLEVKEILRIGMQAAQGLAAADAQGLVHRDVKPANILLENGVECVKLTDFGLARAVDDVNLTQSGVITGTPNYMSPEQADGGTVDHRSDLFSLGSVLYALATGHPPFRANGMAGVLKRVVADTPRPVREINPDMPDWLEAIISKLHAKEPAERFQSAKEVAELLGQHLAHLQQPGQVPRPAKVASPATPVIPQVIKLRQFLINTFTLISMVAVAAMILELWECENPTNPAPVPIVAGILGPLFVIWFAFASRPKAPGHPKAALRIPAKPSRSTSRRDAWFAVLLGVVSCTIAAVVVAHGVITPLADMRVVSWIGQAPPRFAFGYLWLVPFAFGLLIAVVWYRWRKRSREGRGGKGWQLVILLSPGVLFLSLTFFRFPGFDWGLFEKFGKPAHSLPPTQGPRGDLKVVNNDRDADVFVTYNSESMMPTRLVIRKGATEVHQERVHLKAGEKREIHISAIVLPQQTVKLIPKAGRFPAAVTRMQIAPDHSTLAVERLDGQILVFDATTGIERFTISRPKSDCTAFGFTPNGKHLAYLTRSEDDTETVLRVVDVRDGSPHGKELKRTEGKFANARALAFSADGKRLAVSSASNQEAGHVFQSRLYRWEWPSGKELPTRAETHIGTIAAMGFTPDGVEVLAITDMQRGWTWHWEKGVMTNNWTFPVAGTFFDLLATGSGRGSITAVIAGWNEASRVSSLNFMRGTSLDWYKAIGSVRLGSLALSDDGSLGAAGNKSVANLAWDQRAAIRVWDTKTGTERAVLLGHTDWILDVAFTPDGKRLVSTSKDGTVRWWNLPQMVP